MGDPHISVFFRCIVDEEVSVAIPSHPDRSPEDPSMMATAQWVSLDLLTDIPFLPYIPDSLLEYAKTGVFLPRFLSGHFEKSDQ